MSGKFGQHDVREQVPVFLHFLQCGLTNSKLAVLVSRYAQSGSGKRQDFTRSVGNCCTGVMICSKWEWKKTRFYKVCWQNYKCRSKWDWKKTRFYKVCWQNSKHRPHRSLSLPSDHPPLNPQFHISNPDSLVLGPSQHYELYYICTTVTLWVGTAAFDDDDVEQIENLVY